jgi:peroxiredoxin
MPAKDFTVPLLSGASYTLSQDQGKVVLIDFWATWCPPCVAEIPQLKDVYAQIKERGFEIIGISLDSDREVLENFTRQKDLPWRIGFSGNGMDDEVAKLYRVDSAPRYLLVDRKGVVRHAFDMGGKKLGDAIQELVTE